MNSPAILIVSAEKLARATLHQIDRRLTILPTAAIAAKAWADCGEIILCDTVHEMVVGTGGVHLGGVPVPLCPPPGDRDLQLQRRTAGDDLAFMPPCSVPTLSMAWDIVRGSGAVNGGLVVDT